MRVKKKKKYGTVLVLVLSMDFWRPCDYRTRTVLGLGILHFYVLGTKDYSTRTGNSTYSELRIILLGLGIPREFYISTYSEVRIILLGLGILLGTKDYSTRN